MPIQERQTLSKQHAVPQNIMDVEFKLVGDLTMRQFAYLLVCGVLAYISARTFFGIFRWPVTGVFILLGLALAFVPIQERGMDEWIINFFKAIYSPTHRIWKKSAFVPPAFMYQNLAVVKQELITLAPTSSRRKLEEYLNSYEAEADDPLDIPEKAYIMKVRSAFATAPVVAEAPVMTAPVSAPVVDPEPVVIPQPPVTEMPLPVEPQVIEPVSAAPAIAVPQPEPTPQPTSIPQPMQQLPSTPTVTPQPIASVAQAPQVQQPQPKRKRLNVPSVRPKESFTVLPLTPDRHSGRRFTNLLPTSGELVLPIRGEKVIRTSEELAIEEDISDKADKLKQLISQIKSQELPVVETSPVLDEVPLASEPATEAPAIKPTKDVEKEASVIADALKQKNIALTEEIEHLKRTVEQQPAESENVTELLTKIDELEQSKQVAVNEYEVLQRQLLDLQNRLHAKEAPIVLEPTKPVISASLKPLTDKPNIISGIVTDPSSNIIPGIVLIVKNNKGEAVRAVKTDTLGHFVLSTPLPNGVYTLELSPSTNIPLRFDIISVDVNGQVLPPIQLTGIAKS